MKKLILFLGLMLIASSCFAGTFYKSYESTTDATGVVLSVASTMGNIAAKGGYLINDSTTTAEAKVYFSMDGTSYGDVITVKKNEVLNFDVFPQFQKMKVTSDSNVILTYRVLTGINKIAIEAL